MQGGNVTKTQAVTESERKVRKMLGKRKEIKRLGHIENDDR